MTETDREQWIEDCVGRMLMRYRNTYNFWIYHQHGRTQQSISDHC